MTDRSKNNQLRILKVLSESDSPIGSMKISAELLSVGIEISQRTVRFHLNNMDEAGLTQKISRRAGRIITPQGKEFLESESVMNRMKFVVSRIDGLSYDMTFNLRSMAGSVVVNMSLISINDIQEALSEIDLAFSQDLGMGNLVLLRKPGEMFGKYPIPENMIGIGTVCSVTMNGMLLKMSIPVVSRYGCLLKMKDGQPSSFAELVDYLGTTIDPLEIFVRAGMTSIGEVARTGTGLVGASFREVPAAASKMLHDIHKRLKSIGLGSMLAIGKPNQPLLNVPVDEGMVGIAVVGGINPVAAAQEKGIPINNFALHSLADYSDLVHYSELKNIFEF